MRRTHIGKMSFARRRPRLHFGVGTCQTCKVTTNHPYDYSTHPLETHHRRKGMELYRRRTFSTVETTDSTSSAHHVNDQEPNDSLVQPTSPTQQQQQPQQVPHDTLRITARKLLDQRIFPIGSYTEKHLEIIKTILDTFQNNSHESAKKLPLAEVTTLSLELLLRACKEIGTKTAAAANIEKSTTEVATSSNDPVVPDSKSTMFSSFSQNIWIWELQYLSEILKQWQRCRAQKLNVVDGKELFHLFQCMLQSCPGLHPKISTMHVLMDCFVNYVRYKDGVHMALELLQIIDQHDMGPVDEYLYSQAVHAWSMIHHAKTPGIMGKLLRTLHERDIPLTETSYLIVLRYWARCGGGQTQHLQELYDYMKTQQTTISSTANALLIEGYANNGELEHAEKLFDEFRSTNALDEVTPPEAELPPLIRCAHDIIKGYHIIAVDSTQLYADREIAAAKAISFFLKYHAQGVFNSFNGSNIVATVIEIYGSAMQNEQIPLFLWKLGLETEQCHEIIRDLSPSRATDVLVSMLRIPIAPPNVDVFNSVLNAWAESKDDREDWLKQMFLVFTLMKKDPKVQELQIAPNSLTYLTLLKGLANMGTEQAAKCAKWLLQEIESQEFIIDDNISMAVGWATLACLKAEHYSEADELMMLLENPPYTPSVKIFQRFLAHWSSVGTVEAAHKAEEILQRMHSLANSNPNMHPTTECYSYVVEAWTKSGSEEAECRVRQMFYELKALKTPLGDPRLITKIIDFLSQGSKGGVQKSDEILEELETNEDWGILPSKHHYRQVLEAWLRYDKPDRAARIIIRISDLYIRGKNRAVRPTGRMIHLTAKAYLGGSDIDKAVAFLFEFQELADLGLLPIGPEYITWHTLRLVWNQSKRPRKEAINDKIESFMKVLNPNAAIFQNDVNAKKKKAKEKKRRHRLG